MRLLTHTQETDPQVRLLLDDLTQTQNDLANAYSNLEYMTDPDLIALYIMQKIRDLFPYFPWIHSAFLFHR